MLLLGLDGAGKTTLLYQMELGEAITTMQTIGYNKETIGYKDVSFTVWDVGGQQGIRCLWPHYFPNTGLLVYVVDASDRDRIGAARAELSGLLEEESLRDAPLLVLANKQDLPAAMPAKEVVDRLELMTMSRDFTFKTQGISPARPWYIQACCLTLGLGLQEALDWAVETGKTTPKTIAPQAEPTAPSTEAAPA